MVDLGVDVETLHVVLEGLGGVVALLGCVDGVWVLLPVEEARGLAAARSL